jgi:hypothetical protein
MCNGLCDLKGCSEVTYMCWRPLTERIGRKICERHWSRHLDENDSFDLYEVFNFRRPANRPRRQIKAEMRRCDCGCALESGHNPIRNKSDGCRACGAQRRPRHTYCDKCAQERQKRANREHQKRHYRRTKKPNAFVSKITHPTMTAIGKSSWLQPRSDAVKPRHIERVSRRR